MNQSVTAMTSKLYLFVLVVLCWFPALTPTGSQQYCLTFRFNMDYSNKVNNKLLHFLMSLILSSYKVVLGTPTSWDPYEN